MPLQQIKVRTDDLQIGMYISRLDRPWLETPYKIQGFLIKSQEDIDDLLQHTDFVFIDIGRSKEPESDQIKQSKIISVSEKQQFLTNIKPKNYDDITNFDEELEEIQEKHSVLTNTIDNVMVDIINNRNLSLLKLKEAINPMVESIIRNPEAFIWLARMKSKDNYTYSHSVSCAILSVAFGRNLGLPKKDLQSLGMGGLLFDVGKMKLPEKLINNPNRYNSTEVKMVKKHVDYSVEIVQSIRGVNDDVFQMVKTHHERHNGEGYPKGLKGNDIPLFGKIAGIIDCYDALTSDRVFVSAISPHDAIRKLYDWSDIDFQSELVEQFIQMLGIYPVGTIIELSDGRIGVVVAHHRAWRLRPKIMLILDKNKKRYANFEVIDMYSVEKGKDGKPLDIRKSIEPGLYGIDPAEFYL